MCYKNIFLTVLLSTMPVLMVAEDKKSESKDKKDTQYSYVVPVIGTICVAGIIGGGLYLATMPTPKVEKTVYNSMEESIAPVIAFGQQAWEKVKTAWNSEPAQKAKTTISSFGKHVWKTVQDILHNEHNQVLAAQAYTAAQETAQKTILDTTGINFTNVPTFSEVLEKAQKRVALQKSLDAVTQIAASKKEAVETAQRILQKTTQAAQKLQAELKSLSR